MKIPLTASEPYQAKKPGGVLTGGMRTKDEIAEIQRRNREARAAEKTRKRRKPKKRG